jgi:hypothetical protein
MLLITCYQCPCHYRWLVQLTLQLLLQTAWHDMGILTQNLSINCRFFRLCIALAGSCYIVVFVLLTVPFTGVIIINGVTIHIQLESGELGPSFKWSCKNETNLCSTYLWSGGTSFWSTVVDSNVTIFVGYQYHILRVIYIIAGKVAERTESL